MWRSVELRHPRFCRVLFWVSDWTRVSRWSARNARFRTLCVVGSTSTGSATYGNSLSLELACGWILPIRFFPSRTGSSNSSPIGRGFSGFRSLLMIGVWINSYSGRVKFWPQTNAPRKSHTSSRDLSVARIDGVLPFPRGASGYRDHVSWRSAGGIQD